MTDREAKWIALEHVRNAITICFTFDALWHIDAMDALKEPCETFWCNGILFNTVDTDWHYHRIMARRIGGRPFTALEVVTEVLSCPSSDARRSY
jgi:hypothetical protein